MRVEYCPACKKIIPMPWGRFRRHGWKYGRIDPETNNRNEYGVVTPQCAGSGKTMEEARALTGLAEKQSIIPAKEKHDSREKTEAEKIFDRHQATLNSERSSNPQRNNE